MKKEEEKRKKKEGVCRKIIIYVLQLQNTGIILGIILGVGLGL